MSIEVIKNQPVLFHPQGFDESCMCCEEQAPCAHPMLMADGDTLYAQVKMTPCGEELICGQLVSSAELVTDGTFENGGADWDTTGTTWTFTNNEACYELLVSPHTLSQPILGLTEGCTYRLIFETSDVVGGQIRPTLWDTVGTPTGIAENGTFEQLITISPGHVNETLLFESVGTWIGCIKNISLVELPCCWNEVEASEGTSIDYTEEGVCVNGSVSFVSDVTGATTGGERYVVSFTIYNYVSGEVDVQFGSGNLIEGDYQNNGQKFAYDFFLTDTQLAFVLTDFIGCIKDISIKLLSEPVFYAVNQDTGEIIDLGTTLLSFVEDRVILALPLEGEVILSYGCWRLCLVNQCGTTGEQLIVNGEFTDDLSGWTDGPGWFWDNGTAHFEDTGVSSLFFQTLEDSVRACVTVEVSLITGNDGLHFDIILGGDVVDAIIIREPGVYVLCGVIDRVQFTAPGGSGQEYVIDNVSALEIEDCEECQAWCSNCINYRPSFSCEFPLIESYNDENDSFGFVWHDNDGNVAFKLAHRLRASLNNPRYPEESVDYDFSDGSRKDTFGQSDKNWQLFINKETGDERVHDVVRLQKRSDHLFITTQNGTEEYWAEKGDYNPQWPEPAGSCTAPASFRVGIKTSTLYNNLCSE